MIPNIFHFVFGMAPDFGGKPFSLAHYLSVKSAVTLNKPAAAYFHYQYEPEGPWWEQAKPLLALNQIKAPEQFMGRAIRHVAHKADVVRLQVLKETGGIYLDLDTISVKPLEDLRDNRFVIGRELKPVYRPRNARQRIKYNIKKWLTGKAVTASSTGLCNAVLLAEKGSEFAERWLDEYKSFRSGGRDKYWNEHSVLVPERLAAAHPALVTTLGPYAFHYPLYDEAGLKAMFEESQDFPEAWLHHLWESFSWDKYLSKLSIEKIKTEDSTYNRIARRFL